MINFFKKMCLTPVDVGIQRLSVGEIAELMTPFSSLDEGVDGVCEFAKTLADLIEDEYLYRAADTHEIKKYFVHKSENISGRCMQDRESKQTTF